MYLFLAPNGADIPVFGRFPKILNLEEDESFLALVFSLPLLPARENIQWKNLQSCTGKGTKITDKTFKSFQNNYFTPQQVDW